MLTLLERAERHHGAFPHFLHGQSGKTIPFGPKDDGGDLVETSFLMMGLITARQYFVGEKNLAARINALWESVEWNWYRKGENVLYWHWSPNFGWAMNHTIRGWNETLITYVLAAGAPTPHAIRREVYEQGFCAGPDYVNGKTYHDVRLPLGPELGGPLFFAHYSFLGLDPRNLRDAHADYWQQNLAHVAINRDHCVANPSQVKGYGPRVLGASRPTTIRAAMTPHGRPTVTVDVRPLPRCRLFPMRPRRRSPHFGIFRSAGITVLASGPVSGSADAFSETQRLVKAATFLAMGQIHRHNGR